MSEVNHSHYKRGGIEPIKYIESNDLNFSEGSIVKYVTRWCFKNGAQDLCKVVHYALLLLHEYFGLPKERIDDVMKIIEPFNNSNLKQQKEVKRGS